MMPVINFCALRVIEERLLLLASLRFASLVKIAIENKISMGIEDKMGQNKWDASPI